MLAAAARYRRSMQMNWRQGAAVPIMLKTEPSAQRIELGCDTSGFKVIVPYKAVKRPHNKS